MTDIVERLRNLIELGCDGYPPDAAVVARETLQQAVSEIERLRAALQDIVDGRGHDTGSAGARRIAGKALAGEPRE